MVGVWNDLHILANRMAKKVIDQAERQKDIVAYRRSAADDAQEALDAGDGETVAMDDPEALKVLSFGGQQQSNEVHLAELQGWFNQMASNPNQIGGSSFGGTRTATGVRILSRNSDIGLEDMKDMMYQAAASESRKRAWYFHTDPLIEIPLVRRMEIPAQYQHTQMGPIMTQAPRQEDIQIMLTPEARSGDFLDFTFEIEPESMGRRDGQTRMAEAMDFAVKIIPAATQAAQGLMALGIPFSAKDFLIMMAKDRGITWMDQVFYDPQFQQKMAMMAQQGPDPAQSRGVLSPNSGIQAPTAGIPMQQIPYPQQNPMAAILQNGQPGQVMSNPSPDAVNNQAAQQGANQSQSQLKG